MAKSTMVKAPKMAGDKGDFSGMIGGTSNRPGAKNYGKAKTKAKGKK
jgi:hypothetical protein